MYLYSADTSTVVYFFDFYFYIIPKMVYIILKVRNNTYRSLDNDYFSKCSQKFGE